MHLLLLAAASSVVGPPVAEPVREPDDATPTGAVGIVWHEQATVPLQVQQRLVESLLERQARPVETVVPDVLAQAAGRAAGELSPQRAARSIAWRSRLDEVTGAYRAGEVANATADLGVLLDEIRADPVVPGAARLAWQAHVLAAQMAWTAGDSEALDAALAAAVALDPQARPSTREVPPPVVEAYDAKRATVVAAQGDWPSLTIEPTQPGPFSIEIDGLVGRRPVPPGEHLVVLRRPGMAPVGKVVVPEVPWSVPAGTVVMESRLPAGAADAERLCDGAQLDALLLARIREGRLGLQLYVCGEGFGPAWYEQRETWSPGLEFVAVPPAEWDAVAVLHLAEPWPSLPKLRPRTPAVISDGGGSWRRGRVRRALPWILISGAIAGAVTVGILVGTDPGADLAIDGNGFLRRGPG
ncbi:MAG: hypothetical protein K0V04_14900 [Deltaproteobacteria bacterium]|nr:hypothetical protein [Deltaproteobacteria bacterium]